MALFVKKVGSSLLKTCKDFQTLADNLCPVFQEKHSLVVVVSALAGITDRLIAEAGPQSAPSEAYELLLSLGEQYSCAHLGLALDQRHLPYKIFCGPEIGILKDQEQFTVQKEKYRQALQTSIVIVGGFSILNIKNQRINLGRGGSDLTAIILANALQADTCELFKDVPGIYNMDPNLGPIGRFFDAVTFNDLKHFLRNPFPVVQKQAALFAISHHQSFKVSAMNGLSTQIGATQTQFRPEAS